MSTMMPAAELGERATIARLPIPPAEARTVEGLRQKSVNSFSGATHATHRGVKSRSSLAHARVKFLAVLSLTIAIMAILFYESWTLLDDPMLGAIFAIVVALPFVAPAAAVMSQRQ